MKKNLYFAQKIAFLFQLLLDKLGMCVFITKELLELKKYSKNKLINKLKSTQISLLK